MSLEKVHAVVTPFFSTATAKTIIEMSEDSLGAIFFRSAGDLTRESSLGLNTIKRPEFAEDKTPLIVANDLVVQRAMELPASSSSMKTAKARECFHGNIGGQKRLRSKLLLTTL